MRPCQIFEILTWRDFGPLPQLSRKFPSRIFYLFWGLHGWKLRIGLFDRRAIKWVKFPNFSFREYFPPELTPVVRRPDKQPAMLCTEEEVDAGGKFIKEQNDLNGQISELIGHTIQHIKKRKYSKRS